MASKNCEQEVSELRDALKGEHALLKEIQDAVVEGLPPDHSDAATVQRIWHAGGGVGMDPAPQMAEAERVLRETDAASSASRPEEGRSFKPDRESKSGSSLAERDADSPNAIPVYSPAAGDGS